MSFSSLLIATVLAVCLAAPFIAMYLYRLKSVATKADAEAKMLLAKANRELKKNPPRAGFSLLQP